LSLLLESAIELLISDTVWTLIFPKIVDKVLFSLNVDLLEEK